MITCVEQYSDPTVCPDETFSLADEPVAYLVLIEAIQENLDD